MKRLFASTLITLAAISLAPQAAAAEASSARAAVADDGVAGYICLYEHDRFSGTRRCFKTGDRDIHNNGMGDKMSSFINRTSYTVTLHMHKGCLGQAYVARPGQSDVNTHNDGLGDNISSLCFHK